MKYELISSETGIAEARYYAMSGGRKLPGLDIASKAPKGLASHPDRSQGAHASPLEIMTPPPPYSPEEAERIRSALAFIPADDREIWFAVGAALHWTDWGNRARQIWDEWSRTCPGKFDETEQEKAWRSFDREFDRPKIGLGTLFHLAKEHGWLDQTPTAEDIYVALEGLVEKTAADPGAPFAPEALERLAALKKGNLAGFERLRARLKKTGCRVTELDAAVAEEEDEEGGRGPTQADNLLE